VTERLPIRVLGIDPGTASTGFGIVESRAQRLSTVCGGVISTSPAAPVEQRLAVISAGIERLLDEHVPQALAIEEV
jgi:crossover junction endodeoxyribonuclease RuvC